MESGAGFALLTTMVSTFEQQGIITLFEGIEESWQLELAEKSGTSMVQGFVLARPEIAPTSFRVSGRDNVVPGPASMMEETPVGNLQRRSSRSARVFGRRAAP
jgi:EAL domain-containing protein (putative c-di-GMP-specific phosphodiesterase class I)